MIAPTYDPVDLNRGAVAGITPNDGESPEAFRDRVQSPLVVLAHLGSALADALDGMGDDDLLDETNTKDQTMSSTPGPRPNENPYRPEGQSLGGMNPSDNVRRPDLAEERLGVADETDHLGLTLRDLEQLVVAKVARARRDGDDAAYHRERAERPGYQAKAFEEGWRAGYRAAFEEVRNAYGDEMAITLTKIHVDAVKAAGTPEKSITKRDLLFLAREVASSSDRLLAVLREGAQPQRMRKPF